MENDIRRDGAATDFNPKSNPFWKVVFDLYISKLDDILTCRGSEIPESAAKTEQKKKAGE
jgi:hypothetical protein